MVVTLVSFSELRTVAYCPRKCYYSRRQERSAAPPEVEAIRGLERNYDALLDGGNPDGDTVHANVDSRAFDGDDATEILARDDGAELLDGDDATELLGLDLDTYRRKLGETRARLEEVGRWRGLTNPADRNRLVTGKDCRGIVHKVLENPVEPSLLSAGRPPDRGVWEPQSVHAVAAAKALAWERGESVERAWIEYPAYGVIRSVSLSTRRTARYRRALRTVRELDGPPPRISDRSKCRSCRFADECGVRTRTLRSLLGFG